MTHPACPIAVIGIGCLFPGSHNVREFWNTIVNGIDCIGEVPQTHWSKADYFDADPKAPDHVYCTRGGFLPEIDFDPAAFGIPPANLDATDTSQLLGLVVARDALEDAGYLDRPFDRDRAAVILGVTGTQELTIPLASRMGHPHWRRALAEAGVDAETADAVIDRIAACYVRWQENSFPGLLGNVVAGRIANRLDLRGPNCVVDAACASSLAALNLALQELESGRSDLVLTGGVDTLNDIFMHMCFSQSGLLSKSGDIRPFSAEADGTLLGEGIGMVVLKRLADAERDGDRVYAVIRGLGASSDGKSQSIYAPRVEGQVQALRRAYEAAGIDPKTVGLIEAHGTGTRVGDRVEVEALRRVFAEDGKAGFTRRRVLGSVKSQIGHTKAAAGAAGLIKAVLSLHHKVLPPTIKVDRPDPELRIHEGPFELNTEAKAWLPAPDGTPRRAAVSSFGFGGSNFHVVLEEADSQRTDVLWDDDIQVAAFSAADRSELSDGIGRWIEQAAFRPERLPMLAAETRKTFRSKDRFRLLAVVRADAGRACGDDWLSDLRAAQWLIRDDGCDSEPVLAQTVYYGSCLNPPKIGLLFPGQGSQKPDMGRDWFVRFPSAFSVLEAMGNVLPAHADFYESLNPPGSHADSAALTKRLGMTDIAQPAIGAVSIGMWSVLEAFGVTADVFCGHSYGELCALHAAGRIDRNAFVRLSAARGRWMAEAALQSPGGMIAVLAEESVLKDLLRDIDGLVLANRNASRQQVLSGPLDAVEQAKAFCDARGIRSVRLPVSAAFHSPAMRPAVDRFLESLRQETIHPSDRVVLSNADGKPFPDEADSLRLRLADQIASTVDFVSCLQAMRDRGIDFFLEVGPKTVLSGLVRETAAEGRSAMPACRVLAMDRGTNNACLDLAHVLCSLAAAGHPVAIDRWNPCRLKPDEVSCKPAMRVRICGANFRQSPMRPSENAGFKPFSETMKPNPPVVAEPISRRMTENPMQPKPVLDSSSEISSSWHQTLQQGIRSIEAIQRQTAELHQQFLATQAEAMRLVQQMLSGSQATGAGEPGLETGRPDVFRPVIADGPRKDARPIGTGLPSGHRVQATNGYRSDVVSKEAHEAVDPHPAPSGTDRVAGPREEDRFQTSASIPEVPNASLDDGSFIESVLLDVVSRLTGYPVAVLGLDMDIEADLGIDSIKRVEILSAMEEAVSGLVVPAPDEMAGLKTLRQIMERLNGSKGSTAQGQSGCRENKADAMVQIAPLVGSTGENSCSRAITALRVEEPGPEASTPLSETSGEPSERILSVLLESVSRLTGYPVDVLGLDMDIEADLGIDSIKRVEILAAVEEALPDVLLPAPDVSAGLRTLRQIAERLGRGKAEPSDEGSTCRPAKQCERETSPAPQQTSAALDISLPARRIIRLQQTPLPERDPTWDGIGDGVFLVAGVHPEIQQALSAALSGRLRCAVEAVSLKDALELPLDAPLRGLVLVAPPAAPLSDDPFNAADEAFLIDSLVLCARHAASLQQAASTGPVVVAGVSFLDGGFGFRNGTISRPVTGGIAGLVKTAAREWANVRCLCLDVDPAGTDDKALADAMADVLTARWETSGLEIGLAAGDAWKRTVLQPMLEDATYPERACDVRPEDVVVVSGGARGVAASVSIALAKAGCRRIVLLGRSPEPVAEPLWLAEANDLNGMRQIIVQQPEHTGMHPKEIDRLARKWLANREMGSTLDAIRAAGADVLYRSVDVTDQEAVSAVFREISAVWGPVSAMVHAAGVLADRLIAETTAAEARTVLSPKLYGLRWMLEAVSENPPRWIALFSSVAGRLGNRGQAAYAMANEAMNKTAHWLKRRHPDLRVVSLNWGPWNGGMVNEGLKKLFQQSGVPLIEIEAGAAAFLAEIGGAGDAVEVVIGGDLPQPQAAATEHGSDSLRLSIRKEIDVERYPVLNSHVREGVPVVPFSLVTEWMGYGALHEHPGLFLSGLEEIRLLKGIRLQHQPMTVRLMTGKPIKRDRAFVLDVEIRDGMREGRDVVHTRGKAVLTGGFETAPDFDPEPLMNTLGPYAKTPDELYGTVLVHGKDLRGIRRIIGMSRQAMAAELLAAPHPESWMSEPIRKRWLADPLVLDGAFQMAAIWCYEHIGMVCQPVFAKRYRQYRGRFPEDGVTGFLEIRESRSTGMVGDITFLDGEGRVVARFEGLTTTADTDACP